MAEELFRQRQQTRLKTESKTAEKTDDGQKCPYCGMSIKGTEEFCPHCGRPLAPYCTFCGSEMSPGEEFCPECGMSRRGVTCPRCGTLNARAYCRKCNEPLTPAARKEVERAMKDPVYLKAAELAVKMAELRQLLEDTPDGGLTDLGGEEAPEERRPVRELPPDILRLKEMLAAVNAGKVPSAKTPQSATPPAKAAPAKAKPLRKTKAELQAEYARMKAELNATLENMVPPAGSTPQEQRNYYSARRISVIQKTRSDNPVAWVCNYCGCWHNKPSECCEPWHGGTWIYEEKTVTISKEL